MKTLTAALLAGVLACGSSVTSVWSQEDRPPRDLEQDHERDHDRERWDDEERRPDRRERGDRQDRPGHTDRADRRGRPNQEEEVDIEKVKEFIKEMDPRQYEMLQELHRKLNSKDLGPDEREALARRLHDIARGVSQQMKNLEEMKKRNPEEYERLMKHHKLERESMDVAEKLRKAESGTDKGALKDKLKGVLSELFDLREANRAREVSELEKRLKELKENLDKRKQNRDQIIERRLSELVGKEDSMGW